MTIFVFFYIDHKKYRYLAKLYKRTKIVDM
jgi:hypothetical protein